MNLFQIVFFHFLYISFICFIVYLYIFSCAAYVEENVFKIIMQSKA